MEYTPIQKIRLAAYKCIPQRCRGYSGPLSRKQVVLLLVIATLFLSSIVVSQRQPDAYAANPGPGKTCTWYRVLPGDTLGHISGAYRANLWNIAQVNRIANVNLIFIGQQLCIPSALGNGSLALSVSGLMASGTVRWYDYRALQWSTQMQVTAQLRSAAARYGLPTRLLLAVAWQESGWRQHVIARDGGIGAMQLMPYTAMGLNIQTRSSLDPYKTWDNIELGAIYLHSLWLGFHGNLTRVISAYNEGGWNVQHRGIFNWGYVDDVLALMRRV